MSELQFPALFVEPNSRAAFLFLTEFPCVGDLYYSPDGTNFSVVLLRGGRWADGKHSIPFSVSQIGLNGRLERDGDIVTFKDKVYTRQEDCSLLELKLPGLWQIHLDAYVRRLRTAARRLASKV